MIEMFKLAHLSDPHLGPLPAARVIELLNKRASGFLSWHLNRRRIHDMHCLQIILDDIKAHSPDHIALTGDLINIALPAEYENALRWLEAFGTPQLISLVPGNHDAYIAGAWQSGFARWASYCAGDTWAREGQPFPFVRLRRNIALIGASSAIPTAIGVAAGRLGAEQIEALGKLLRDTRQRGFFRVLMIHHPPVPGLCPPRKSLLDAEELLSLLKQEGAELVLFGHDHRRHHVEVASPYGQVHMFGVSSASLKHDASVAAGWNLYNIRRQAGAWVTEVTMRDLDLATGSMFIRAGLTIEQRSRETSP
jgi:3',5'-cyclic AMP phosphodiesterase CpdA